MVRFSKKLTYIMCFLYKFCLKYFSFEEELREISKLYINLHIKYPLLSRFDETWDFLDRFSQNTQISNFSKILPLGDELLHSDRHDEADSRFSQFCERA